MNAETIIVIFFFAKTFLWL